MTICELAHCKHESRGVFARLVRALTSKCVTKCCRCGSSAVERQKWKP